MNEEDKWHIINACETYEELAAAIMIISEEGTIHSNRQDKTFDAAKQVRNAWLVIQGGIFPNVLTRAYGIRQQALYIRYYEEKEKKYDRNDDNRNFRPASTFPGIQETPVEPNGGTAEGGSHDPIPA